MRSRVIMSFNDLHNLLFFLFFCHHAAATGAAAATAAAPLLFCATYIARPEERSLIRRQSALETFGGQSERSIAGVFDACFPRHLLFFSSASYSPGRLFKAAHTTVTPPMTQSVITTNQRECILLDSTLYHSYLYFYC